MAAATLDTLAVSDDAAQSHKEHRHSRHKKASDPFLEVDDDAVKLPDPPSPNNGDGNGAGTSQSLLVDLVLTPTNMISLLLSLFLVDHEQRQWRLSQHASHPGSLWARLTSWDPEPYQESYDRNSGSRTTSGGVSASDNSYKGWYTRKKHRAMAKLELTDALEIRGRVVVALLAWFVLGLLAFVYAVRRLYGWVSA